MNPQPDTSHWNPEYVDTPKEWRKEICLGPGHRTYDPDMWCLFNVGDPKNAVPYTCRKPNYLPGEIVYIKETWAVDKKYDHLSPSKIPIKGRRPVYYKGLYDDEYVGVEKPTEVGRWRSPCFMPEWANRSHALIVNVRPERIQSITIGEVRKEGFIREPMLDDSDSVMGRHPFVDLWDTIYPGSWDRNDFVLRLELEKKP